MIRNKSNINVKAYSLESKKILESRLPTIYETDYSSSRIRLADDKHIKEILRKDVELLK
jgi:hypothetical protein